MQKNLILDHMETARPGRKLIGWENRSRHSIEQISQQLSEQTNALTQLIKVITKNTEL